MERVACSPLFALLSLIEMDLASEEAQSRLSNLVNLDTQILGLCPDVIVTLWNVWVSEVLSARLSQPKL